MSRNDELRFEENPTSLDMSRSRFDRNSSVKTSFNVGDLIPFYVDEVLPGDTFSVNTSKIVRLQTLITPMMDNLFLDFYFSLFQTALFGLTGRNLWEKIHRVRGFLRPLILYLKLLLPLLPDGQLEALVIILVFLLEYLVCR